MAKLQGRIRYEEDWKEVKQGGEWYLFEIFREDTQDWGLDTAFPLKYEGEYIHYTALTKIREWQNLGIEFYFGK